MEKKTFIYYAVFSYADDGISIDFPDLPGCISCGFSEDEALQMAKEALNLYFEGIKENQIPKPSDKSSIKINKESQRIFPLYIEI